MGHKPEKLRAVVLGVCAECRSADPGSSRLIVIRGNSASGKSTIGSLIREKHGRGLAVVGQDNLRRVVLREHDTIGAANVGLIDLTCRFALGNGFHVVLEGILRAERYGAMLAGLREEYADRSSWWFIDIPFSETLQRHSTKPQVHEYGEVEMRSWWHGQDFLPGGFEQVITVGESAEAAATRIMTGAGLTSEPRSAARPNVSQLPSPIHRRSRWLIVMPASSMPTCFCAVTARSCCCAEHQVCMPRDSCASPAFIWQVGCRNCFCRLFCWLWEDWSQALKWCGNHWLSGGVVRGRAAALAPRRRQPEECLKPVDVPGRGCTFPDHP
jgi:hypothetical protein